MPPAEVRPQTFDSFQSPDSASPAVRLEKSKLTCGLKILYLNVNLLCPLRRGFRPHDHKDEGKI